MLLGLLFVPPLVAGFTLLLQRASPWAALHLWAFLLAVSLLVLSLYPAVAALFNKFEPLQEGSLRWVGCVLHGLQSWWAVGGWCGWHAPVALPEPLAQPAPFPPALAQGLHRGAGGLPVLPPQEVVCRGRQPALGPQQRLHGAFVGHGAGQAGAGPGQGQGSPNRCHPSLPTQAAAAAHAPHPGACLAPFPTFLPPQYGFGRNKRIVLYDTLIEQCSEAEVVAVLAHELGHW